jgi:lipopolysaccharide export system protein LptA
MRILIAALIVALTFPMVDCSAQAAETSNFKEIVLRKAGKLKINYKSKNFIQRMEGGVDMTFVAEDEASNMDIQAEAIDFDYSASQDGSPSKMVLTGNVSIKNGEMTIKAPKAIVDMASMKAEFIGGSKITSADGATLTADTIIVNLETGDADLTQVKADRLEF